jgi:aminoglycoside phosphotransferase (APT) family kinase protein
MIEMQAGLEQCTDCADRTARYRGGKPELSANMVKMHVGEIDIDIALVERLLAEQFPHLAEMPITLVHSTGTVNVLYRLGDEFSVRLPRLTSWAGSIENEWTWLPKLAPYISLNIPKPLALGRPTHEYPCPWAIYEWLDGSPYREDLIDDERQVAGDLANFILQLRSVDRRGAPGGGRRPLCELDAATRAAIEASRHVLDADAVSAAWARSLESTPWDGKSEWIHGDLLASNLLVQEGRLCAVIDFGSAGIGDPVADVVPAWSVFNSAGRQVFRQTLGVDDDTWSRARGYALHQALLIIPYYPETNPGFVTMAQRTVSEVLADVEPLK